MSAKTYWIYATYDNYELLYVYRHNIEFDYEVRHVSGTGYKYHVNLQRWMCDCRKWLLTRLP